jgi:hypothetical protein
MNLVTEARRWWLRPASPEPLAALRLLVGGWAVIYVAVRARDLAGHAGDRAAFDPVGILSVLGAPYGSTLSGVLVAATVAVGIAFVTGWRFRVSGPLFALALLWVTTWRNSWGQVFHTENLLVLHVAIIGMTRSADRWSLDSRRPGRVSVTASDYAWPVRLLVLVTALTYVVAGVVKLRYTGLSWVTGDHLRHWVAYDNLRKIELGDRHSPLGAWLTGTSFVWPILAVVTVAVELGAPLTLFGGKLARRWVLAAWGFHVGVLALMAIVFPYPLTGVAFAPALLLGRGGGVELPRRAQARGHTLADLGQGAELLGGEVVDEMAPDTLDVVRRSPLNLPQPAGGQHRVGTAGVGGALGAANEATVLHPGELM